MTSGGQKRTRLERVAALELPPGQWELAWVSLRRRDVLGRTGLALLAAIAVGLVIRAWDPPFAYRTGYTPDRDIVAKVSFTRVDSDATNLAKQCGEARSVTSMLTIPSPWCNSARSCVRPWSS